MRIISLIVASIAWIIALVGSPGYWSVVSATIGSILFSSFFLIRSFQIERKFIAYKLIAAYFATQPLCFLVLITFYPSYFSEDSANIVLLESRPFSLFFSFCLIVLIGWLFSHALIFFQEAESPQRGWKQIIRSIKKKNYDLLLIIAALINLSIWASTLNDNLLSYFFRVLYKICFLSPFFAGIYFRRSRSVMLVWVFCFTISMVFSILTGSRGYAFSSVGLYGLGVIVQAKPGRERWKFIVFASICAPLLIFLAGVISGVREDLGRKNSAEIDLGAFVSSFSFVLSDQLSSNETLAREAVDSSAWKGLHRLVDWAGVYVPAMSPDLVPYRGYDDYKDEVSGQFSLKLSGRKDSEYNSRIHAARYGLGAWFDYEYGVGRTSSTVPFNIFSDSWSRFGFLSTVIQVIAAFIFFTVCENLIYKFFSGDPGPFLIGMMVILEKAFFQITTYTLLEIIRDIILQTCFIVISFLLARELGRYLRR